MDIKIIGLTDQHEAYVGSKNRKFRINEFLIIEDIYQGDLIGEIVEAHTYNKFIPMVNNGDIMDANMLNSMEALGFDLEAGTIYLAKIRLVNEANFPIETGSNCRVPNFEEVKKYFISTTIEKGLNLGVIRNTDDIYKSADREFLGICKTLEDNKFIEQRELPYIFDLFGMHEYPHIGVFGGSGSGKSFGLRVILEELMKKNIPTITLDPHYEMDFSDKFNMDYGPDYSGYYSKFIIGKNIGIDFTELNTKDLKNLLNTSSRLTDAMENVVDNLHKNKDSLLTFENRLQRVMRGQELGSEEKINDKIINSQENDEKQYYKKVLEDFKKYNDKCPPSSITGVSWRFDKLKRMGIFEHKINEAEIALKSCKNIVIQGSIKIIQVFATYIINVLYEKRRNYKDAIINNKTEEYFPPFIVVTDEAHNFAPQTKDGMTDIPSKYILREIAQEGRKYGVFLILATQRPSLLDSTITAQLNTKLIFRTNRATDIQTIKEETDLSIEETNRLPYLKTGDVFLSESALGRTMYVRIRAAHTNTPHKENPFEELLYKKNQDIEIFYDIVEKYLPVSEDDLYNTCKEIQEDIGKIYSVSELKTILESLYDENLIEKEEGLFGTKYILKENIKN